MDDILRVFNNGLIDQGFIDRTFVVAGFVSLLERGEKRAMTNVGAPKNPHDMLFTSLRDEPGSSCYRYSHTRCHTMQPA